MPNCQSAGFILETYQLLSIKSIFGIVALKLSGEFNFDPCLSIITLRLT
jgi:hypothetical protein